MAYVDFAELKTKISISQVAQMLGLTLTQKSDQFRGICPIHKGTNPREFVITASKNLWYCFGGCGGGDQIALVEKVRGIKTQEAAGEIAKHFGATTATPAPKPASTPAREPPAPAVRKTFDAEAYAARLDVSNDALAGLGVSPETLKAFKAGYASSGKLRGRLALPLCDRTGTVLCYCGRALGSEQPELVYGVDSLDPKAILFGWDRVEKSDSLYVVGDPVEVLRAHEGGITNVVSFLGDITSDGLQVLSHFMDELGIQTVEML